MTKENIKNIVLQGGRFDGLRLRVLGTCTVLDYAADTVLGKPELHYEYRNCKNAEGMEIWTLVSINGDR